jgi:hypothetical protein
MQQINLDDIQLQALQIPIGWRVQWNQFFDVEPGAEIEVDGLPEGDVWELFPQDLLQLKYDERNLVVDLGWLPEADPDGRYILTLVENKNWDQPMSVYESTKKGEIVKNINLWLKKISSGSM